MIFSDCQTKKRGFATKEIAEDALIDFRSGSSFRESSGPINVYQCDYCSEWHFTSKGTMSKLLKDESIKKQIDREGNAKRWEDKWRRR